MVDNIHILNVLTMLEILVGGHLFAGWNARRDRFPLEDDAFGMLLFDMGLYGADGKLV